MSVTTELFDLTGKVALLTGASKGMGEAMAQGLAEHGAKVVISSRKLISAKRLLLRSTSVAGLEVRRLSLATSATKSSCRILSMRRTSSWARSIF